MGVADGLKSTPEFWLKHGNFCEYEVPIIKEQDRFQIQKILGLPGVLQNLKRLCKHRNYNLTLAELACGTGESGMEIYQALLDEGFGIKEYWLNDIVIPNNDLAREALETFQIEKLALYQDRART